MNKKTDIVNTARALFSQFGLKKVTTDDIARESGISKATIYKYFRNKSDILNSVVDLETEILLKKINRAVAGADSVLDKLKAYLLTKITTVHELINFYHVTREYSNPYWPYIEEARNKFMSAEKKIMAKILRAGNKNNELAVDNIELAASIIITSLKSHEYEWSIQEHNITLEKYIDFMINTIINGIGKR